MKIETTFFIGDLELIAIGDLTPYRPATMYQKNGDPGDPEEGGEIEDLQVFLGDTDITELVSKKVIDVAEEAIVEAQE